MHSILCCSSSGLGETQSCYSHHPKNAAPTTWHGLRVAFLWLEPKTLGRLNPLFPTEQRSGCRSAPSQSASWRAAGNGSCSPPKGTGVMDGNGEFRRTAWWRKEERAGVAGLYLPGPTEVKLFSETLTSQRGRVNSQVSPVRWGGKQDWQHLRHGGLLPVSCSPLSRDRCWKTAPVDWEGVKGDLGKSKRLHTCQQRVWVGSNPDIRLLSIYYAPALNWTAWVKGGNGDMDPLMWTH